ncbi:SRPBCC family protein [Nocardia farcinica]|uniref:SRPBCC family protein n=1 Tax=Nocardia farcinica TaxID=37329 RepID=UPI0015F10CF7|nr:SRPBCC family protein [Nocardia farcinica]MBA4855803.1 SRPBCC family protein [Nocardia farcinica]MBC9815769.1 SRPBCC family protein [Nocardia farcinica]
MRVDVRTEIVIDRPPSTVAAFAADPTNVPRWYANIHEVRWVSEPPLRTGSQLEFAAQFLGRRLVYTYEVTEYVPGSLLVMRTARGSFPMETSYTWEPTAAGTRMTLRNRGEPAGFSRVLAPVLESAVRRANRADLARLKAELEAE